MDGWKDERQGIHRDPWNINQHASITIMYAIDVVMVTLDSLLEGIPSERRSPFKLQRLHLGWKEEALLPWGQNDNVNTANSCDFLFGAGNPRPFLVSAGSSLTVPDVRWSAGAPTKHGERTPAPYLRDPDDNHCPPCWN